MVYHVQKVNVPADLKQGQENGRLDESLLTTIQGSNPKMTLHHLAARAWSAMCEAAKRDIGIELQATSAGDSYRSYKLQVSEFERKYQLEPVPGRTPKQWDGKTWYLKASEANENAIPGKSNHGWGLAIDVGHLEATPVNELSRWVLDNYEKFGFSHEWEFNGTRTADPRHIRYYVGDEIPPAVRGEDDMAKAFKVADNPAVFIVTGIVASWVVNPQDYAVVVGAGLAPPADQIEVVDKATFRALRLVGAIPKDFTAADFQEVVGGNPPPP